MYKTSLFFLLAVCSTCIASECVRYQQIDPEYLPEQIKFIGKLESQLRFKKYYTDIECKPKSEGCIFKDKNSVEYGTSQYYLGEFSSHGRRVVTITIYPSSKVLKSFKKTFEYFQKDKNELKNILQYKQKLRFGQNSPFNDSIITVHCSKFHKDVGWINFYFNTSDEITKIEYGIESIY